MSPYTVVDRFMHGEWSYRPGEVFTAEELAQRGMDEAGIQRALQRGVLAEPEPAPSAAPVRRKAATDPQVPGPDGN